MLHRPDFQQALRYVFEEKIPFCRALELKFRVVHGRAEVSFAKQDFMLGNTKLKVLHGGVTAAVLDSIAGIAIMLKMAETGPQVRPRDAAARVRPYLHHRPACRLPGAGERRRLRRHRHGDAARQAHRQRADDARRRRRQGRRHRRRRLRAAHAAHLKSWCAMVIPALVAGIQRSASACAPGLILTGRKSSNPGSRAQARMTNTCIPQRFRSRLWAVRGAGAPCTLALSSRRGAKRPRCRQRNPGCADQNEPAGVTPRGSLAGHSLAALDPHRETPLEQRPLVNRGKPNYATPATRRG